MLAKLRFASSAATAAATRRVGPSAAASSRVTLMAVRWNQQAPAESHIFDEHDGLRRRLLYRSKQRGWLEMDIMLGNWARDNLGRLDGAGLQQFQEIIDMENPDLYRWLTGQDEVPDTINNSLLFELCRDLKTSVAPKVSVKSSAGFEGKVWE